MAEKFASRLRVCLASRFAGRLSRFWLGSRLPGTFVSDRELDIKPAMSPMGRTANRARRPAWRMVIVPCFSRLPRLRNFASAALILRFGGREREPVRSLTNHAGALFDSALGVCGQVTSRASEAVGLQLRDRENNLTNCGAGVPPAPENAGGTPAPQKRRRSSCFCAGAVARLARSREVG